MKATTISLDLAGRTLSFETGRLALQATSSVLAKYGETSVLAAVTLGPESNKDYFPLSVEYQERFYAGGRIKGSRWVKREGRPTDAEVLSARLIDRSIRPLFSQDLRREVQVIVTVLSVDLKNDADILAVNAVSAALACSPIPWSGPVGSVSIGLSDGQLVVNPENGNRTNAGLDLVVASTQGLIHMLEAGADQVPEDQMLEALKLAHSNNRQIIQAISDFAAEISPTKLAVPEKIYDSRLVSQVEKTAKGYLQEYITEAAAHESGSLEDIKTRVSEGFDSTQKPDVYDLVDKLLAKTIRQNILEKSMRPDGRKLAEIRPLSAQVAVLPRVHGSALFARGQTQVLSVVTLGAPSLYQSLETAEGEDQKRYMHHYNFPPYSTGETGRVGSPSRREIGHGALAERALLPVLPSETEFPYAIRVVSEILSSNGSTSMGSVCGSSLALMDAGVPISAPVAGISIGKIDNVLLTDIIGLEDFNGDMDFKVAGTFKGITAIQLDTKVAGLTLDICREIFLLARAARLQVLETMHQALSSPRSQLSAYAPKINSVTIPVDKIGELIGPGGKVIKKLMAETGTTIDVNDEGQVFVSSTDQAGIDQAISWISSLGKVVQSGEVYEGTVVSIQPFGAFVNILPGKDGLVHISRMGTGFVSDPNQIVKPGQKVKVWVSDVDSTTGKIGLSMLFDSSGQPLVKSSPPRDNHRRFHSPQRDDRRRDFHSRPRR